MAESMNDPTPDDPETDALIEALAHAYAIRDILGPVVLRRDERHRVRLAVQQTRAKRDAASRERRSA